MKKRKLGNSGIEIAPLALGGNVFGWTADETTSFRILDGFVDAGFDCIDTADVYAAWAHNGYGGQSEEIIGKWFKRSGRRKDVILATKVGMQVSPGKKGLAKSYIRSAVEDSLRRLQTDYIDLYQSHTDDSETPFEETLSAYAELLKEGKVRAIGASNYTAERLSQALEVSRKSGLPRYESLQPLYNLYDRAVYETELEPLCLREHVGVITYYSLAAGFLSGKYRSEADLSNRARGGTVKKYLNERGFAILDALDETAKRYSVTPAHVAIAWLMARPSVTAPIVSATGSEQLQSLLAAARLELDRTAIDALDRASAERVATAH
jgi:aryl-alcohol dehydrogenase-like predicted oxidoreductase